MTQAKRHTLIKVCGITNAVDALEAVRAGANWLGLIFVPTSPRAVTLEDAQTITEAIRSEAKTVKLVGVFQNTPVVEIQKHITALDLDLAQLHGDESLNICAALSVPVIKTVTLKPGMPYEAVLRLLEAYSPLENGNIQALLLDTPKSTAPTTHAWMQMSDVLAQDSIQLLLALTPHFMAGGLTAETVTALLQTYAPEGVDVASGVEMAPGKKDPAKLRAFCHAVRQWDRQQNYENAGAQ